VAADNGRATVDFADAAEYAVARRFGHVGRVARCLRFARGRRQNHDFRAKLAECSRQAARFSCIQCMAFVHAESQRLRLLNTRARFQTVWLTLHLRRFTMKPKEFFEFAKNHKAEMIDLKFVDMLGTWQHCCYPIEEFDEGTFADGVGFDGSSIRG